MADFVSVTSLPASPLWKKTGLQRRVLSFDIELTARCNNNCRHCYVNVPADDAEARSKELSPAEITDIADQAVALGALWCLITGGEPLLRPDFPSIYLGLKKKGLLVSVFTNACLINEEHIKLFRMYPPRDLEVTVYGTSATTYEAVTRRPGSYAAFRRGFRLLLDNGVRVRLKAMAVRSNVHELPDIAAFCRQYTRDYFRFDPFLHLRVDGDLRRNEEIRAERLSPEEIVATEQADMERVRLLEKHCNDPTLLDSAAYGCDHLFRCGAGIGSFSVSYDGFFRLCPSLAHPDTVHDLRKGTVADAWRQLVPRVRSMRSTSPDYLNHCGRCSIVHLCLQCPAHAYLENGSMDARCADFCAMAHLRAETLAHQVKAEAYERQTVGSCS